MIEIIIIKKYIMLLGKGVREARAGSRGSNFKRGGGGEEWVGVGLGDGGGGG